MAGRRPSLLPGMLLSLALSLLLLFAEPAHAAPHNMTVSALEAEIARLTEAAMSIKQDASASKRGTPVHGEVLQKPASVPQQLWPDVGNNEFNWVNMEQRNFALMNASMSYANIVGIETPAFGDDGTAYLPDQNGALWKFPPPLGADTTGEIIAHLPGRPLGIVVDRSLADPAVGGGKSLVVAVAGAGVFRVSLVPANPPSPTVTMLTSYASVSASNEFPGVPASAAGRVLLANGVAVARATGAVYFTDSIRAPPAPPKQPGDPWDTFSMSLGSLYSGDLSGRLVKFDPATQKTTVVSTGSWFSNGIVLSDSTTNLAGGSEDQVIMCETFSARLAKVALSGASAGEIQPFAPSLPGYCDGVFGVPASPASTAAGTVGTYYVAINSKQAAAGATAIAASPQLRWALARAPQQGVEVVAPPFGLVVRVDSQGKVAESLQDPSGQVVGRASSATLSPDGTTLFMGSVTAAGLPFVKVA